jgi:RND family efflux transporter MFP subunit
MALTWAKNGSWAALVLLVGGALTYVLWTGKADPAPQAPPVSEPPRVDVVAADPARRALSVHTQGTVRPLREIKLVSQVGGRVQSVSPHFSAGSFFAADEQLLKIEDVDYEFDIARAQSQVAAARQRVAEEEGRALQAKREWRDLGSDKANALFLRKPQLASAQAALQAAEADLDAARLDHDRTTISGPFNGRISEKLVDVGQYITPGTPIAAVYDTDVVQVRLPLTDRQVALLDLPLNYDKDPQTRAVGVPVTLKARFASRDWEWQGRIVRTDASIDVDSRVVYAVAEVDKPFARDQDSGRPPLSPGLFVSADITGRQLPDVSILPRSALLSDDAVMLVDVGERIATRPVRVLWSNSRQAWVQGLERGDRVVVRGASQLIAGTEVTANNVDELADGAL